jgi:hypothetical protein
LLTDLEQHGPPADPTDMPSPVRRLHRALLGEESSGAMLCRRSGSQLPPPYIAVDASSLLVVAWQSCFTDDFHGLMVDSLPLPHVSSPLR